MRVPKTRCEPWKGARKGRLLPRFRCRAKPGGFAPASGLPGEGGFASETIPGFPRQSQTRLFRIRVTSDELPPMLLPDGDKYCLHEAQAGALKESLGDLAFPDLLEAQARAFKSTKG